LMRHPPEIFHGMTFRSFPAADLIGSTVSIL
jgi:hypothetical protein